MTDQSPHSQEIGRLQVPAGKEQVVALADLAAFILAQDQEITDEVAGLDQAPPDPLVSAQQATERAGEWGRQAGRRAVLTALTERFFPEKQARPADSPAEEERLAG